MFTWLRSSAPCRDSSTPVTTRCTTCSLKAVVVRGTKGRTYADHQKVWELHKAMSMNPKNQNLNKNMRLWAH